MKKLIEKELGNIAGKDLYFQQQHFCVIKFSQHALFQMKIRRITRKRIFEVIEAPDSISEGGERRVIMSKAFGRKLYRVICAKENEDMIIITVYKTIPERYENEGKV